MFPCRSEAKLDVRPRTMPYIIKKPRIDVARFLLLVDLTLSFSLVCVFFSVSGAAVDVRLAGWRWDGAGEGQWGKAADARPVLVATAPSVGGSRKGVVCIRLFKVVPTASASSQAGGNQTCLLQRHIHTVKWRITSLFWAKPVYCFTETNHYKHIWPFSKASLCVMERPGLHLGEGSGYYWLKGEFSLHLEEALECLMMKQGGYSNTTSMPKNKSFSYLKAAQCHKLEIQTHLYYFPTKNRVLQCKIWIKFNNDSVVLCSINYELKKDK